MLPLVYQQDVKLLECLFNSIAYLFKFLSRQILPDINETFDMLSKLLGEDNTTKPYIRHFSAEAFAFLMRKARGQTLKSLTEHILESLYNEPSKEYTEGLAMLFFECTKQVDHRLHSRAEAIYKELLTQTGNRVGPLDELDHDCISELLNKTTLLILHHTYRQHFSPIINIVLEDIDAHIGQSTNANEKHLLTDISVLTLIVTVRKASRVEDFKPIITHVHKVCQLIFTPQRRLFSADFYKETLRCVTGILCFGNLDVVFSGGRLILDSITSFKNANQVYGFFVGLAQLEWANFTQVALPYITKYISNHIDQYPKETIFFLSELLSLNAISFTNATLVSSFTANGLIRFPVLEKKAAVYKYLLDILNTKYDWEKELDKINNSDLETVHSNSHSSSTISIVASVLTILPTIDVDSNLAFNSILSMFESVYNYLSEFNNNEIINTAFIMGHKGFALESLLGLTIQSLVEITKNEQQYLEKLYNKHDILMNLLKKHSHNEVIVKGLKNYLAVLQVSDMKGDHFTLVNLEWIYNTVKVNLRSYQRNCRLFTMELLSLYEQPLMKKDSNHKTNEVCDVAQISLDMEEIVPTMSDFRDKIILIQKLYILSSTKRIPDLYEDFIPLVCLGLLTVNFKPLWEEASKILRLYSEVNPEIYWKLCFDELAKFEDERKLVCDGFSSEALEKCYTPINIPVGQSTKTGNLSFECPTYTKYTTIQNYAFEIMNEQNTINGNLLFIKATEQENGHMDFWNYYNLILKTLKETPSIVEQRSRYLIPIFFKFLEDEYNSVVAEDNLLDDENDDDEEKQNKSLGLIPRSVRNSKSKMIAWLQLFSGFSNPRVIYKSQDIYNILLRLIAKGDLKLQSAALEALFAWKDTSIKPYCDNLRNLVDDAKFRDELSTFLQNRDQHAIDPSHRSGLLPIVMRVLFGRLIERRSKGSKHLKKLRRKAILSAIACCKITEIKTFIDLAFEPFQPIIDLPGETVDDNNNVVSFKLVDEGLETMRSIAWRQQQGLMNVLEDMIKQLGSSLLPFMPTILKVVLYILHFSQNGSKSNMDIDDDANDNKEETTGISNRSKQIRSLTMRRLIDIFMIKGGFNFTPYIAALFHSYISPRLNNFVDESSQQISSLLSLFAVWADTPSYVTYLTDYNPLLLQNLYAILSAQKIDEQVFSTLLTILERLLDYCDGTTSIDNNNSDAMDIDLDYLKQNIIINHVNALLEYFKYRLNQSKDDKRFGNGRYSVRQIGIIARIAPYTKNGEHTSTILDVLIPSLKKPSRLIPEHTKKHILSIWSNFMPFVPGFECGSQVYIKYYKLVCNTFSVVQSRESRQILIKLFQTFVDINPSLIKVGNLLENMNAYSKKKIDEPDYDKMLESFGEIAEDLYLTFDHLQWLPLLHQLIYNMQDPEEMAVRGTATHCVTRFLLATKEQKYQVEKENLLIYVNQVVFASIKRGLLNHSEMIRLEFVNLLNEAIKAFPELPTFVTLVPLLGNDDEEVNFFNNIYHIQVHRRLRAMARLSEISQQHTISVPSINNILLPIVSGFIYQSDRQLDHNLIHQAITTIGALAKCLPWGHYYRLLSKYLAMVSRKDEMEKIFVRLVTNVLESFHFDISQVEINDETAAKIMGQQKVTIDYLTHREIVNKAKEQNRENASTSDNETKEIMDLGPDEEDGEVNKNNLVTDEKDDNETIIDDNENNNGSTIDKEMNEGENEMEDDEEEQQQDDEDEGESIEEPTENTTPEFSKQQAQRIHDTLIIKVLPELNSFISKTKSRKSVISRMPVALGIAKILRQLPEKSLRLNLPGLLTIVCQTIRSRAQDVRDIARDTLLKINTFLGVSYFQYIVKELKSALLRGYELHVLGYTVNALLYEMSSRINIGDLDYCMEDIVQVLINDIFGKTGQEKEAEGMTGKTKEAKSHRSPATYELLAKLIKFSNVGILLVPLKNIMSETQSLKVLQKVDDLFKRIALGLVRNAGFDSIEILDFTNDLIAENVDAYKAKEKVKIIKSQKEKNFEVQMKRVVNEQVDYLSVNSHRFVYFGLSLLNSALKREKYDLSNEEYSTRLNKLVTTVGNVLYSNQSANVSLAAKNMCILYRLPLPAVNDSVPVVIKRIFQLLKHSTNTNNSVIQSCFKLLTVCILTKKSYLTDHQLTYLIKVIIPDLEEPERRGTAFGLVKAIVTKKFVAPEMYDLMDIIGTILVTNQTPEIREQARSLYFMFLMDYPQGVGRLKKQMASIIKNLEFVHESGRESVMELLHHIINKFGDEILAEFSQSILLALIMQLINDESSKCREMSAELIKSLLLRMEDEIDTVYKLLDKWMDSKKPNLQRAGSQVYGLVIDAFGQDFKLAPQLIDRLAGLIENSRNTWMDALKEQADRDETFNDEEGMDIDIPWEVGYYSLNTFAKVASTFPNLVHAENTIPIWHGAESLLLHPHSWVRSSTSRLFGVYFSGIDPTVRNKYLNRQILRRLSYNFVEQLKSPYITEEKAGQIIKNLFFIGKCLYNLPKDEDTTTTESNEQEKDMEDIVIEEDESDTTEKEQGQSSLLWLFHRASYTARGGGKNQNKNFLLRSSIFKWFAAMCNIMKTEDMPPYLFSIIAPIYHTVNGQTSKEEGFDNLKDLGNEVLNLVQKKAGPTAYFAVYQNIRQHSQEVRVERKTKRAIEAITNPELAAKRKMTRNLKKSKKRVRFNGN
ncbi:unnamed protein product [Cunninghamella echinulata]